MNYKKHYKLLIESAKNKNRSKKSGEYYESHHIIPDFMFLNRKRKGPKGHLEGDPNDPKNLVLLTPREHILAHILLCKSLKGDKYYNQASSAVMWFFIKVVGKHQRNINGFYAVSKKYERYRILGLSGISESRKNKIPVKDANTGIVIGSISKDHPKILSGEWVHITKGRKISQTERENRKDVNGKMNPNFKEMTEERKERLFNIIEKSLEENHLMVNKLNALLKKEFTEFKSISIVWIRNNFGNFENLALEYNKTRGCDIKYNPYYRSANQKQKSSKHNSKYIWVTDGQSNLRIKCDEIIPEGFNKGRKI